MFLEVIKRHVVVLARGHLLCERVQLEILRVEVHMGSEEVVAVALVGVGELDLVNFVFNH